MSDNMTTWYLCYMCTQHCAYQTSYSSEFSGECACRWTYKLANKKTPRFFWTGVDILVSPG